MQYHLITVGETMLRYSVPVSQRLETMRTLDVYPAGAEANVAVSLIQIGAEQPGLADCPIIRWDITLRTRYAWRA